MDLVIISINKLDTHNTLITYFDQILRCQSDNYRYPHRRRNQFLRLIGQVSNYLSRSSL